MLSKCKTKIGIIEIWSHHIFLYTLASIATKAGCTVEIFTTREIFNLIKPLLAEHDINVKINLKTESESDNSFLQRNLEYIENNIDLLFINTIQGRLIIPFSFFNPKVKTMVAVGRTEEWFKKGLIYYGRNNIREFFYANFAKRVLGRIKKRIDGFIVHTDAMASYISKHINVKPAYKIPFAFPSNNGKMFLHKDEINFVIIGNVEKIRRDYFGALRSFENIWKIEKSVKLTLLGRPVGKFGEQVINHAKILREKGCNIRFYNEFVPEMEFITTIQACTALIAPINLKYYQHGVLTSAVVEAIRSSKPCIYPKGYMPYRELKTSSLFYDNIEDLSSLILHNIVHNIRRRNELAQNAIENANKFSLDILASYFKDKILSESNQDQYNN